MDYRYVGLGYWFAGAVMVAVLGCGTDADEGSSGGGSGTQADSDAMGSTQDGSEGGSADETGQDETTGGGIGPAVCDNPQELTQPSGAPSGFVQCESGLIERVAAVECEPVEAGSCDLGEEEPDCSTAADCGDSAACVEVAGGPGSFCRCQPTCRVDADCEEGSICGCAPLGELPQCIPSGCASTGDCGDELCAIGRADDGCNTRYSGACMGDQDPCRVASDCGNEEACMPLGTGWVCEQNICE